MHIAILDTDIPVPSVYFARGLYSTQFRTLLQAAADRLNHRDYLGNDSVSASTEIDVQTSSYDTVGGVFPPLNRFRTQNQSRNEDGEDKDVIDGILITGSTCAAYEIETKPWIARLERYIQTVYHDFPAIKLFGSCFGHQIIAQALFPPRPQSQSQLQGEDGSEGGGERTLLVEHCPHGFEIGIFPITLHPAFNESFPYIANSLPQGQQFRLQLVHGDRVVVSGTSTSPDTTIDLPPPWLNVGYTAKCPIQGLYNPRRVLTYQGHFEFDTFVNGVTCAEFGERLRWDRADVEKYLKQINVASSGKGQDDDDSKVAAEAVVLFFAGRA